MNASPRGWYHGWSIVAVCILMQAVANGLTYNAFSLFLSDWSAQLHAPVSRFHLSVAAMALLASLAAPGVGVLADKLPARRLLVGGLLGIATFYFLTGSVQAIWQFSLLYGLLAPFGAPAALTAAVGLVFDAIATSGGLIAGMISFLIGRVSDSAPDAAS